MSFLMHAPDVTDGPAPSGPERPGIYSYYEPDTKYKNPSNSADASFSKVPGRVHPSSSYSRSRGKVPSEYTTGPDYPYPLNLLCFDGGGVRGLSSLYILQRLLTTAGCDTRYSLPVNIFDMIGGTSTGGLIAIMLGRLEMSVDECIAEYTRMASEVFKPKRRLPLDLKGNVQARYDHKILEAVIQDVLRRRGLDEDELFFRDTRKGWGCPTFVCATPMGNTSDTTVFRSYPSKRESDYLPQHTRIWEAARATSAASTFFKEVKIGPHRTAFLDGGFYANNPVNVLWNEASDLYCAKNENLADKLGCIISIGTGVDTIESFGSSGLGLLRSLCSIATQTERTARQFEDSHWDLCQSNRYFRFNVDELREIGLQEANESGNVQVRTEYYLKKRATTDEVERCAETLYQKRFN